MQGFLPDSGWHIPTDKLTDREKEVLVKIAEGPSAKEAALKLHVALPTVKSHRVSILFEAQSPLHTRSRGLCDSGRIWFNLGSLNERSAKSIQMSTETSAVSALNLLG